MLSSRFPVAVQILIIMAWCPDNVKITSELLATSVNTNPVIIRRIMAYLKNQGLITTASSIDGAKLIKAAEDITLLDVYKAVELTADNQLFGLHENTNPHCPIGKHINTVLKTHLGEARRALENSLSEISISELTKEFSPFAEFYNNLGLDGAKKLAPFPPLLETK
ncbi:MAG TPA: Rrf2 family transcriptional regulator [Syntrophomonadaceae bacterium]|nr:Rrf2 family transcriptional regulator [Syntrophomonadaceae bacterium]